jgi:hypothetical protein
LFLAALCCDDLGGAAAEGRCGVAALCDPKVTKVNVGCKGQCWVEYVVLIHWPI